MFRKETVTGRLHASIFRLLSCLRKCIRSLNMCWSTVSIVFSKCRIPEEDFDGHCSMRKQFCRRRGITGYCSTVSKRGCIRRRTCTCQRQGLLLTRAKLCVKVCNLRIKWRKELQYVTDGFVIVFDSWCTISGWQFSGVYVHLVSQTMQLIFVLDVQVTVNNGE